MTTWLIQLPCDNCAVQALYWYRSAVCGYGWTTLAWEAERYSSREAAEAVIDSWAVRGDAFAAEHLFADPASFAN